MCHSLNLIFIAFKLPLHLHLWCLSPMKADKWTAKRFQLKKTQPEVEPGETKFKFLRYESVALLHVSEIFTLVISFFCCISFWYCSFTKLKANLVFKTIMVSTWGKKQQNRRLDNQLDVIFNDFFIGSSTQATETKNDTIKSLIIGFF